MSKFGMQIAGKSVYNIKTPTQAIDLIEKVIQQYFGEFWTQHKPRCPLCNEGLEDTEKYMNRPVGECVSPKCDSTIHISDFMGKIKDVCSEWDMAKDDWLKELQSKMKEEAKKIQTYPIHKRTETNTQTPTEIEDVDFETIDEETIFVW